MKLKSILAAAIVCVAVVSQAEGYKWRLDSSEYMTTPADEWYSGDAYVFAAGTQQDVLDAFFAGTDISTLAVEGSSLYIDQGETFEPFPLFQYGTVGQNNSAFFAAILTEGGKDYVFISEEASVMNPATGNGQYEFLSETACANVFESTTYSAAGYYTQAVTPEPLGSKENPWLVGSPNEAGVKAWTNGTGKLTIEGTGETWPDFLDKVPGWASVTDPITSVEIGEGVTSIGACAFCRGLVGEAFYLHLASVKLPSTLKTIGEQAFAECAALTAITLPEGLQTVGLAAFALCSLADVTIPASVGLIGSQAFYGQGLQLDSHVHTLKSVTVLATKPSILEPIAFDAHAEDFVIHVPAGTAADYRAADGWNQYAKWIDDGTGLQVASIFPNGDGGKFVPAAKGTVIYNGAVIAADGVAGTVELKMKKPNRNGEINFTAKVVTADNQRFSFKANATPAGDAPLTVTLVGTNKKSKEHALTVTLEGNSLKGTFDGATIDGASDAFKDKASLRALAIAPFIGTWTGAFNGGSVAFFSAKISAKGKATVKVTLSDGKSMSCSAKAEVGDGVIAVPVTVRKSVKGAVVMFGFRLAFGMIDGKAVCEASDIAPIKMADKKTGEVIMSDVVKLYAADELAVTSKEFKAFAVKLPENLTKEFGEPTNLSLKMASTGLISGSIKFGKVKAKASGVVIGGRGVGLLTVTQKAGDQVYEFSAEAAK